MPPEVMRILGKLAFLGASAIVTTACSVATRKVMEPKDPPAPPKAPPKRLR